MLTKDLMERIVAKNPGEKEFHQAVNEVFESLEPVLKQHPEYLKAKILERMWSSPTGRSCSGSPGWMTRARCR